MDLPSARAIHSGVFSPSLFHARLQQHQTVGGVAIGTGSGGRRHHAPMEGNIYSAKAAFIAEGFTQAIT
jgi:hypothetical protein